MYKPKTVDNWPIDEANKKIVKRELKKWLELLISYNDGHQGNIIKYDILNKDLFYFTDCRDIISRDPEFKAEETNHKVIRRKQYVFLQILLKNIMDGPYQKPLKCSHCGSPEEMRKMYNGHYRYCPTCHKIAFVGYVDTLDTSVIDIQIQLARENKDEKALEKLLKLTKEMKK